MKTFKKTLALFLATLMIVSAFAAYSVFATTNENEPAVASVPAAQNEGNTGTKTENWAEETREGVTAFYIDNLDDFKAFHDDSQTNNWYTGKKVILNADLDMTQASWSWTRVASFRGTLDGQGHTINLNLTDSMYTNAAVNATFQNLKVTGTASGTQFAIFVFQPLGNHTVNFKNIYINMTINGSSNVAAFVCRQNNAGAKVHIENCVNESTISTTAYSAGGFVATVEAGATVEIINSVFAGSITGTDSGSGGFIGKVANASTVTMTDCAFTGNATGMKKYSSPMIGYMQGGASLTRCVVLAKEPSTANLAVGYYGALFYSVNNVSGGTVCSVTATDCYAAVNAHPTYGKHGQDKNTITADITTIANSEGSILTAANFKALCPELAANKWVVTTKTVTYGTDLTIPEILPATVATMLGRTVISESPVNAEQWHVKDNGDTVDVRFIGSIKEDAAHLAAYDNVGIKITVTLKGTEDEVLIDAKKYNSTAVYTSMYTDVDGVDAIIAEDGTYLFGANMRGFKKDSTYEVTFTAYATYNGVDIYDYDGATTITVENGAIAE
ncbi:MAG: hypothetical protein IJZ83_05285 [Clostridia bacterium]|nr:hypothetical protein [Clostridia bacterium]